LKPRDMATHRKKTESGTTLLSALMIMLLALMSPTISAAQFQSHTSIMEAAGQHILAQSADYPSPPEVIPGRLDSRLRLKQCDQPLESYTPQGKKQMGKITVGVRCNGTTPWSLFVPVTVKVMTKIVVATNSLPRGSIIQQGDVTMEMRDISRLHRGFLEDTKAAVGKKLRQRIGRNQVITPSKLVAPLTVKRNNRVLIRASNKTIQVSMAGKALQNGSMGQVIRVKNESSNKEVDARVVAPGIVEVPM
jgi:flagella basal body P-ring formation protein FlgA